MTAPRFSVIVPVWNGSRFLEQALASVHAQDLPDRELIVVDDCSTDDSVAIARALGARVIQRPVRGGVAAARNDAIRAASGELLAFLDQDDIWEPGCLTAHHDALTIAPHAVSIVREQLFAEPTLKELPAWFGKPALMETQHAAFVPSGMAFSRETFLEVGWFDESYQHASDLDWFARARSKRIEFHISERVLVRRRLHEENDSRHVSASREMLRTIHENILRNRLRSPRPE